jgi:hypothetical protein
MRLVTKVGINYHRPLSKFDRIVIKSTKNLAKTSQDEKTTYQDIMISGSFLSCSAKGVITQ